ncbi:MAG: ATP synthase F1 subunit epsilon [Bacteroidales bacterium]|nr:ATP synthase F1 subunit epsilon [Bacteroidales bacterium]
MHLSIVTPEKELFNDTISLIQLPGIDGSFEILENHAPIISSLSQGQIKVIDQNNKSHLFEISGGVIECSQNTVIVLVETENK